MERAAGRFALGSRVTVCADEACTRVIRFGTVKRIGNEGASWRLQGTGEWYDALTGRRLGDFDAPYFARPYREGDEALQGAERAQREAARRAVEARRGIERARDFARSDREGCERAVHHARADVAAAERHLGNCRARLAAEEARLPALRAKERGLEADLTNAQVEEARLHGVA